MDLGQILRVSAYASNGQLTRVKFYQLPTSLNRYAVIDRNSLQLSDFETSTHFSFSVLHPVNAPKGSTYEFARNIYRRIDLAEE
jgi:hypothetical protein